MKINNNQNLFIYYKNLYEFLKKNDVENKIGTYLNSVENLITVIYIATNNYIYFIRDLSILFLKTTYLVFYGPISECII